MTSTLVIDADVLRYQMAFANTSKVAWDDGDEPVEVIQEDKALAEVDDFIDDLMRRFGADDFVLPLSCKRHNFRKDVFPTYKSGRHAKPKPALWAVIDEHLNTKYASKLMVRDSLEGDDILGLLATHPNPKRAPGKRLIVSIDKDLQTIPCRLWNPSKPDIAPRVITPHDADLYWMKQTLTGDSTDEYPGCPGIGPKKADAALVAVSEALRDASAEEHLAALWQAVVQTYEFKGLTAEDALTQARCARILRHGDYDYATGKVALWSPPK
ncbi:phage exonuclease [Coralloluteibacterium stylophorae]